METKLFELRDEGTFIPIITTLMNSSDPAEAYLLRRAGYSFGPTGRWFVLLDRLDGGHSDYRAHSQHGCGGRTYPAAHLYIQDHWWELASGQVIDVEYLLGERDTPKESEFITASGTVHHYI